MKPQPVKGISSVPDDGNPYQDQAGAGLIHRHSVVESSGTMKVFRAPALCFVQGTPPRARASGCQPVPGRRWATQLFHHEGVAIDVFQPEDRYLDGVDMQQGYVIAESDTRLDVRAQLACERWVSDRRRAILGARFGDRPFIFGLEPDARLTLHLGEEGSSLRDLEAQFRT